MIMRRLVSSVATLLLLLTVHTFAAVKTDQSHRERSKTNLKQSGASATAVETATGEEINWQVISSGGTEGTSTNYALKGTLGQTAVGFGSSTSYGLSHGFWQAFGCCVKRGDVNHDCSVNVADLTYLVDYLFFGGPAPPCTEEGDVDGSGAINVADLTYLVDYLFFAGPPPAPC